MKRTSLLVIITACVISSMMMVYAQNGNDQPDDENRKGNANLPAGYGDLSWGSYFSEAREKVKGTIVNYDENKRIVTRDGEIQYNYGYFYPDPEVVNENGEVAEGEADDKDNPARLYFVVVRFPYVAMEDVKKKVVEKYGEPQGESMRDNQGAYSWESDQTTVIMWVDSYNDKPYCRKLTYMSKLIARDINKYRKDLFNKKEREILRRLSP